MIPVYCVNATDNRVMTIDDAAVDTDDGTPFEASVTSVAFEAGAWSGFRRFMQTVHLNGTATVIVTPITDDAPDESQTLPYVLSVSTDGSFVRQRWAFASHGSRHQVLVRILAHSGLTELGEWGRHLVPRRSERGGP